MAKHKLCPLLAIVSMASNIREEGNPLWLCQAESCQWWVGGDCAIVKLAQKL